MLDYGVTSPHYMIKFDANNVHWASAPEANILFLTSLFNYMDDVLAMKGYVFLNDYLDHLHVSRTRDGQLLGWIQDKGGVEVEEYPGTTGDGFNIQLNFKTHGVILDLIKWI
jgi:hypothetical protein